MYQGNNITAIQSQKWLGESLIKLMEQQDYQTITIGAICKEADLSRQTFYNVFDNKDDILRFCLRTQYENQFHRFENQESITVQQVVGVFSLVVAENQKLLRLMVKNNLESILTDEMTKCVSLFADYFVKKAEHLSMLPYSRVLLSGALGHLLVYWFQQKQPISIEQLTHLITNLLEGNLFELSDGDS